MKNLFTKYNFYLEKRPIITKAISAFFVFGLGDYLCQEMEKRILKNNNNNISIKRIVKQGAFGALSTPYIHFSYCKVIPYFFPDGKKYSFIKSLIYAVTISDGIFNFSFFTYMAMSQNRDLSFRQAITSKEVHDKFIPVQITNLKVWPILSGLNFYFVPIQFRVQVDSVFVIFWNIYLSYVENNNNKKVEEEKI